MKTIFLSLMHFRHLMNYIFRGSQR